MGRIPGVRPGRGSWWRAGLAVLAAALAACAVEHRIGTQTSLSAPVSADTDLPGPFDRRCELVDRVEVATRAEDPQVREGAVYLLGRRGPGSSVDVVGAAVRDPDGRVRRRSFAALATLAVRSPSCAPAAVRYLLEAVESSDWTERKSALRCLASLEPRFSREQAAQVRRHLDDDAGDVQVAAGFALHHAGCDEGLEPHVVRWLDSYAGSDLDFQLAYLLDLVVDPAHLRAVERLFQSPSAEIRHLAHVEYSRLEGTPERWAEAAAIEREWLDTSRKTVRALERETWIPAQRDELLESVHEARLVLFGETHSGPGALRDAQAEALRAFVRRPKFEALGYEPTAIALQQPILDLARQLGLQVIPLETNWENLGPTYRLAARDLEARNAIESFLAADPSHRMFVIRGEYHVHPDGFLLRRLSEKPLLLLSVVELPLWQTGLFGQGSTHRSTSRPNVYRLGCEDEAPTVFPKLVDWLGSH